MWAIVYAVAIPKNNNNIQYNTYLWHGCFLSFSSLVFFHKEKNHVYLLYTAIDKLLANNLLKQLNGAASGPISQRRGFCHNQHAKQNKIVTA